MRSPLCPSEKQIGRISTMASQVHALFLSFFAAHDFDGRAALRSYLEGFDCDSSKRGVIIRKCIPLQGGRAGRVDVVEVTQGGYKAWKEKVSAVALVRLLSRSEAMDERKACKCFFRKGS